MMKIIFRMNILTHQTLRYTQRSYCK